MSSSIEIKVTVEIIHRLCKMIYDVPNICVYILIVGSVDLIVEEFIVTRIGPRVTKLQLPQSIINVRCVRIASSYFNFTRATSCVFLIRRSNRTEGFLVGSKKDINLEINKT